jgi:transketolase
MPIRWATLAKCSPASVRSAPGARGSSGPSVSGSALRAVHGFTVLHPSDADQASALVAATADTTGISFLRTPADEPVWIGGSRIVRGADAHDVAIVACGVTVDEADNVADALEQEGFRARLIDCYSIKPIDVETLQTAARECRRDR